MSCPACGTAAPSTAKFCHKCGANLKVGRPAAGWRAGLPWGIAGAAVGALLTVLVMRSGGGLGAASEPPPSAGGSLSPPDISQMSPEERASRLFNRVMILAQSGKQDSVDFFLPMAVGAYQQLPALDSDARYHVGLLQLAGGNTAAALAEADTILRGTPTHLFGFVLRAHAYQQLGDRGKESRAYADFLKAEPAERARSRPEYDDHKTSLDAFHTEALRRTAGTRS